VWRARSIVAARAMYAITKSPTWRDRMLAPMFAPGATPLPFGQEVGRLTLEHWIPDLRPFPLFRAAQLARLTAPLLVLAGEHDVLFDDATLAAARRVIPNVVAERLDGCGHMFDVEHADAIRARTLAFLRAGVAQAA
jgi:pimeloyl-ACP methyl ester carboxylesterase